MRKAKRIKKDDVLVLTLYSSDYRIVDEFSMPGSIKMRDLFIYIEREYESALYVHIKVYPKGDSPGEEDLNAVYNVKRKCIMSDWEGFEKRLKNRD